MAAIGHCQSYFAGKLEPAQAKRQAYELSFAKCRR
jgi:hypothetical protein